jgi:hypothetical protein
VSGTSLLSGTVKYIVTRFLGFCLILPLLATVGCKSEPDRTPAIAEAFAGPGTLNIRQDIAPQSPVVATATHGERLEILQRRRRFVKVRTARHTEGWTDERLLLSPQEVASLKKLSEQSKSAPSQGAATTYETINIHTAPDRQSPSFLQVKEGEKIDVIGRRVAPRVGPPAPRPAPPPAPKSRSKKSSKDKKAKEVVPPPPMPSAPKPPREWLDLSKLGAAPAPPSEPQPVPMDDWSLVRNAAGQSGWVLTRRLTMAIPDEVAQYAEGRRITSYFPLGDTRDGSIVKPSWLWTTVEQGLQPHDFDSFRVFVWSLRHHRYETAHIERNLRGFFPVLTHPVALPKTRNAKDAGTSAKVPGFSLLIEKKDGLRYRRSYTFVANAVRLSGEERVETPSAPAAEANQNIAAATPADQAQSLEGSFFARTKERIKRLLGR